MKESPLYEAVGEVGLGGKDITNGYGTQTDLEDLTEFMSDYNIMADPSSDRYLLQDDQHQYELNILHVDPENGTATVVAEDNGFAKEGLEDVDVLYSDDFAQNPKDEVTFDNGSNALAGAAEKAPDRARETMEEKDGEILEPETESGWGVADGI